MSPHHPNERQLQAFLTHNRLGSGPPAEYTGSFRSEAPSGRGSSAYRMDARELAGLAVHLEQCRECRGKLDQFRRIELELNRLPVEQPDPGLTDRIMLAIDTPPSHDAGRRPPIKRIRAELVNGYIALAATYLFVSTGVWQHIIAVSQVTLGIGVESRVHEAIELVVKLYRIFTA